jgi:NTE family protein
MPPKAASTEAEPTRVKSVDALRHPNHPNRRDCLSAMASLALLASSGCTLVPDRDHDDEESPRVAPLKLEPRVAWVLSSGGPRGIVHVGVIQALDELGLVPDLIVGSSAGAIVGVLRAAGVRGPALVDLALNLQLLDAARYAMGGRERLSSLGIADWLRERLGHAPLERLSIPMVSVAYNVARREIVPFAAGDAGLAVAAASAIEGRLTPVRIRGDLHVDADLHQPLPVRVARALGAKRVLAVDASAHEDKAPVGTERWRDADLRKRALTRADAEHADVVLHPDAGYYAGMSLEHRKHVIAVGYRETMAQAPRLKALHERSPRVALDRR